MNKRIRKKRIKKTVYATSLLFDKNIYFDITSFNAVTIKKMGGNSKTLTMDSLKLCINNIKKNVNEYANLKAYYENLRVHEEALNFLQRALRIKYLNNKNKVQSWFNL